VIDLISDLSADEWIAIGSIASAISAFAACFAIVLVRQQLVISRRVTDLNNNLDLFQKVTEQFDKFCARVEEEGAGAVGDFPKSRRELINLLALFEHIASAKKMNLLRKRSSDMVVDQVIDLVERLMDIDFSKKVIQESRHKPDILAHLAWLIQKNYRRFESYEDVFFIFSISSRVSWLRRKETAS